MICQSLTMPSFSWRWSWSLNMRHSGSFPDRYALPFRGWFHA